MAGIVFWFELNDTDVFSGRPVDLDAWRYAIKAGGIDKAVCFNESELELFFDAGFDFTIGGGSVEEYELWIGNHKDLNLVFIETERSCPPGAISISSLDHNNVDYYIFGRSNGVPRNNLGKQYVFLPQNGVAYLHSVHIASAVLLRRWEELNKE